jgi:hypothetical protein
MSEISDEERNPIEAPEGRRFRPDISAASGPRIASGHARMGMLARRMGVVS